MEQIYSELLELISSVISNKEEIGMELLQDLAKASYEYTGYRYRENFYTPQECSENDQARTSKHNQVIDCFNIFLRYEKSLGNKIPELPDDRKIIGDYANQLIADLAKRRR